MFAVVMGMTAAVWAQDAATQPATSLPMDQELTLQTLKRQLGDPKRTPETRLDAARLLLTRTYPQAMGVLRQFLADPSNIGAQQAIAEAIAEDGGGRKEFIQPLLAMLTGDEPLVRSAAARALVTYQGFGVTDRLIGVARNPAVDRSVRRVTIEALQRIIDKRCIEVLIELLSDPDPAIRSTAAESLRRMTSIRSFGSSRSMWEAWFARHRDMDDLAWLRDMNDGLTRGKMVLERENALLRARLIESMESLYNSTPKTQRSDILLGFLNDDLPDVRLLGETLTDRMIAGNQEIPPEVRQRVRLMLFDDDPRVRESAAVLEANLADAKTPGLLLGRLRSEQIPDVRVGLLKALGRLASLEAVPALLTEIRLRGDEETAAAAAALGRIAEEKPLSEADRTKALKVLENRYRRSADQKNSLVLRESLLSALGSVGDEKAQPVLIEALQDSAPVIRLVAVSGLLHLQAKDAAGAIAPLVQDDDRGVRQAALETLIVLGGKDYLKTILLRTDPKVETDPAVRKEAIDGVLKLCEQADVQTLDEILKFLARHSDSPALSIQVLLRKADVLKTGDTPSLATASLREAGQLMLADNRATEAVPVLAEAWRLLAADTKQADSAKAVWFEYIHAMLEADQPTVVRALTEQANPEDREKALQMLLARLETLQKEQKYLVAINLAGGVKKQLADNLTPAQSRTLEDILAASEKNQQALDYQQVEKLLPNLTSADAATRDPGDLADVGVERDEAKATLDLLGVRAAHPLLEELRKTIKSDTPDAQRENALYELLKPIIPDLGPYDPTAEKTQRLAKVNLWMRKIK